MEILKIIHKTINGYRCVTDEGIRVVPTYMVNEDMVREYNIKLQVERSGRPTYQGE